MANISRQWSSKLVLVAGVLALAACGLPRSGPSKNEIFSGSVQRQGNAYIVSVNDRVIQATQQAPSPGFDEAFRKAGRLGADTIRAGDVLELTIYENVEEGLLGVAGAPSTLNHLQVDQTGHIFVPYAGRIRAAGNSPEKLRNIITQKLDTQTPDPQVIVRRVAGDGATVTITGSAGQGVVPIEASTSRLSSMLAKAGGITTDPEQTRITVIRGALKSTVWLEDLYRDHTQDIAMRGGDRILVQEDKRRFTALGATGGQALVEFPSPTLSAVEALAQMGGLNSNLADPTGIFVFRDEAPEFANRVLARNDFTTNKRFAYVLDLTEPTGMFLAREFDIRDGDTIYVTEAPYVQWTKTLNVLTGSLSSANVLASSVTGG